MSANVTRGFNGYTIWKKLAGSGAGFGAETVIPYFEIDPQNPYNNIYPPMVNKAAYPSVLVMGKRTPSVNIRTALKASWATANNLNSLIITPDANGDTDNFGLKIVEPGEAAPLLVDGCQCAALSLAWAAAGGPVTCDIGLLATTFAGVTSFSGSGSTDAGEMFGAAQVDFGASATADLVRDGRLNLVRPNAYDMFFNQSYYPSGVSAGQLGGTLTLGQSPKATIVPSSTVTVRLFTGVPGSLSLALTIVLKLNLDVPVRRRNVGFGHMENTYTLIDTTTGGVPVSIT